MSPGSFADLFRFYLALFMSPNNALLLGEPVFKILGFRRRARDTDLLAAKRILVIRLDEIGDVVLTSPLLRELRRSCPNAWITLVVTPLLHNLVEQCPYVNEVLTYDPWINGRLTTLRLHKRALHLSFHDLWPKRFDLALLPRWDTDYYHGAFLLYFSGANLRAGYSARVNDTKRKKDGSLDCLFTHLLTTNAVKHEVERNLELLTLLGKRPADHSLEIWTEALDETFASRLLSKNGVQMNETLVAFGIGAGAPKRIWPLTNFENLGEWLIEKYQARIVLVGGQEERLQAKILHQHLGDKCIDTVTRTTLRQTAAVLKRCHLFVGNDAGPMHLAAAAGTAIVEISCHPLGGSAAHPNSPLRFGPWGVPHLVLQPEVPMGACVEGCKANQPHCILGVDLDMVKEGIVHVLNRNAFNGQQLNKRTDRVMRDAPSVQSR